MFPFRGPGLSHSLEEVEHQAKAEAEAEAETGAATCSNSATLFHTEPVAISQIKFI